MMLAELLRMHGVSAGLGSADSLTSEHADRISNLKPDVVAISLLPPIQRRNGRYLLKRLRANHPEFAGCYRSWQSADIPSPLKSFPTIRQPTWSGRFPVRFRRFERSFPSRGPWRRRRQHGQLL